MSADCSFNSDPLRLAREGTSQEQRFSAALDPGYARGDERGPAHGMVFAQTYSAFLKFYNSINVLDGNWKAFFSGDISAQLAGAAVEDVTHYRQQVKEYAAFLNNRQNETNGPGLRDYLDYLFSCCATLAIRLNQFTEQLPEEIAFRNALRQLVQNQLAPALRRLIAYHKGGEQFEIVDFDNRPLNDGPNEKEAPLRILGGNSVKWSSLATANLSKDWTKGAEWGSYFQSDVAADASVYGAGTTVFERVNHLATHNLFTAVFDQFLKVYARTVSEAQLALDQTLTAWDRHEPHYALFLAFLRLFEHARQETNTLTGRHLDFYYRTVLQLKERPAEPGHAHLLVELAKAVDAFELKSGERFKAGKDDLGRDALFANERDVVANQAKVVTLKSVYRHGDEPVGKGANADKERSRLYASPVSNSDDGLGAPLTTVDQSWHPFHNKLYQDGALSKIEMPKAEVGFAIASHYLWMAEGERTVIVQFVLGSSFKGVVDRENGVICQLTSEKGWFEKRAREFGHRGDGSLWLTIELSGADPAVTPYSAKTHGYSFATDLPVLLVTLRHEGDKAYLYEDLRDAVVDRITLFVGVEGLKTLALSNDFGPVDTSKPFQPFGALPVAGSALVLGSKEMFQKSPSSASIQVEWLVAPHPYKTAPKPQFELLGEGQWRAFDITKTGDDWEKYDFANQLSEFVTDESGFGTNDFYSTASRFGFLRLKLSDDFGQDEYQRDLIRHVRKEIDSEKKEIAHPGSPPVGPQ